MLEPYAIVTARNVVASMWKEQDRHRRNRHRVADMSTAEAPDQDLLKREEGDAMITGDDVQQLSDILAGKVPESDEA